MFKVKIATIAVLVGGILFAALSYLLPVPHLSDGYRSLIDEASYHSTLAFLFISSTYGFGGALLFLLGLNGLSTAFRRTYYSICAGFFIQSLGSLYYAYGGYRGVIKNDTFYLIAEIPLMIGIVVIYIGLVKYARLLRISNPLTKPVFVTIGFILLMAIVWVLPHRSDVGVTRETLFDIAHALQSVELISYAIIALIAAQIHDSVGPLYARSIWWLKWAMVTAFPPTLVLFLGDYVKLYKWINSDAMSLLFIVTSIFTICSAYAFSKITRTHVKQQVYDNSLLDSVIFLGSLASNPTDIDPILDKVRVITSNRTENTPLDAQETHTLQEVYTELETYLTTKEQLRTFSRAGLTELVQERFNWTPKTQSGNTTG